MSKRSINIGKLSKEGLNEVSLKSVFYQYYAALCFFAEKLVQDRTEAEDIVEEVFIKLWEKEPDFSKHKNIKAILYIAVKNACFNFIAQRRRNNSKLNGFAYTIQQETESYALLEIVHAEVLRGLYAELENLPTECRNVMQLVFIEGWEHKKIAEHLDISISTVKTHKARGINALRKKMSVSTLLLFLYIIFS